MSLTQEKYEHSYDIHNKLRKNEARNAYKAFYKDGSSLLLIIYNIKIRCIKNRILYWDTCAPFTSSTLSVGAFCVVHMAISIDINKFKCYPPDRTK